MPVDAPPSPPPPPTDSAKRPKAPSPVVVSVPLLLAVTLPPFKQKLSIRHCCSASEPPLLPNARKPPAEPALPPAPPTLCAKSAVAPVPLVEIVPLLLAVTVPAGAPPPLAPLKETKPSA